MEREKSELERQLRNHKGTGKLDHHLGPEKTQIPKESMHDFHELKQEVILLREMNESLKHNNEETLEKLKHLKDKTILTHDLGKNDPVHQLVLITRERDEFKRKFEHEKKKISLLNNFGEKNVHKKCPSCPAGHDEDAIRNLRA